MHDVFVELRNSVKWWHYTVCYNVFEASLVLLQNVWVVVHKVFDNATKSVGSIALSKQSGG